MTKKVWKIVADIPQNTLFMMYYPMISFFEDWPKMGLGAKYQKYFSYFKGDFCQMAYIAKEFDDQAEYMAKKMIKNPVWALKILKVIEGFSPRLIKTAKTVKSLALDKMTDSQIIKVIEKVGQAHRLQHGIGASLTWHADAEKEFVTRGVMKIIKRRYRQSKIKKVFAEVFAILTTPTKESYMEKEEVSFLKVADKIDKKTKFKEKFIKANPAKLSSELKNWDKELYQKIRQHYNTFAPATFQYKGPAYPLTDYLGRWQALLKEGQSPVKLLSDIKKKYQNLKTEQRQLFKELKLNQYEKNLVKMAQLMVYTKDDRKTALYQAFYYYEFILKEVAKRLNLSLNQVWMMQPPEVIGALKTGKIDSDNLNQRQIMLVDCWQRKGAKSVNKILTGREAKQFLNKIVWQKTKIKSDKLTGTCAYPGKVTGIVKIVNIPSEMSKMKQGNIMVAHNTNPNLVPAMKKAAALVGAAGGLTCHTAIVAREMKIPCLVGVLDCDRILRDGDQVEVDATRGIVKKI